MFLIYRFRSVVVITSALHAEGREFEPRRNLKYFSACHWKPKFLLSYLIVILAVRIFSIDHFLSISMTIFLPLGILPLIENIGLFVLSNLFIFENSILHIIKYK